MGNRITLTYCAISPRPTGWKYLWMKTVTGFDSKVHCARCLIGKYNPDFGLKMPANVKMEAEYPEGTVLYLCGVSTPYRWANNFHLAIRVKAGAHVRGFMHNGDIIEIAGAEMLQFDDAAARAAYPGLGEDYLTCRNFQFGAQQFGQG